MGGPAGGGAGRRDVGPGLAGPKRQHRRGFIVGQRHHLVVDRGQGGARLGAAVEVRAPLGAAADGVGVLDVDDAPRQSDVVDVEERQHADDEPGDRHRHQQLGEGVAAGSHGTAPWVLSRGFAGADGRITAWIERRSTLPPDVHCTTNRTGVGE